MRRLFTLVHPYTGRELSYIGHLLVKDITEGLDLTEQEAEKPGFPRQAGFIDPASMYMDIPIILPSETFARALSKRFLCGPNLRIMFVSREEDHRL